MNKSDVLRALEWVDRAAAEGDVAVLSKAKQSLDDELASHKNTRSPAEAYAGAVESFIRKHGRDPLEDIAEDE
ncbi:MAG: hypothetical protein V2B18_16815 [Pseudomonadota bacterium]